METNTPLNAPFGRMGGKSKLRPTLAALIPEQDIPVKTRKLQRYVEVFGGAAWLLLYKNKWFRNEVYNDINDGLVNLFSVIRFHPGELIKEIELVVNSQKLFHYYKDTLHLTNIQKAAGTLIKYGWSFSGKGDCYSFKGFNSVQTFISKISGLRERFQNVRVLKRASSVGTKTIHSSTSTRRTSAQKTFIPASPSGSNSMSFSLNSSKILKQRGCFLTVTIPLSASFIKTSPSQKPPSNTQASLTLPTHTTPLSLSSPITPFLKILQTYSHKNPSPEH